MINMEEMINKLKELLATSIALKHKAQGYHWNVETDDFPQYHEFFGEIYEAVDASIDPMAEWIRMMGAYAPFKLSRLVALSTLPETDVTTDHEDMSADLLKDHKSAADAFGAASIMAASLGQKGLENFLADCQTTHQKYVWQLTAIGSEALMEASTENMEPAGSRLPEQD